jgi:F0F1-type ATP synthase membrane subunit c/vacuolar-type H+-ATPase subunit K
MLPKNLTQSSTLAFISSKPRFSRFALRVLFTSFVTLALALPTTLLFSQQPKAQTGVSSIFSGISVTIPWESETGEEGDVVVIEGGEFALGKKSYDENIYGVIVQSTALSLADRALEGEPSVRVVSSGEAYVKVSAVNGDIKSGDYLTTSFTEGVAQLADISGYVLGIALEDFSSDDPDEVGTILAHLDIKSAYVPQRSQKNLLQFLSTGALSPIMSPLTSFRYLLSALVVVASFIVGFSSFGKISSQSVESMGRNPLASKDIKSAVVFNFIFTFGIMIAGIVVSYLVLVL